MFFHAGQGYTLPFGKMIGASEPPLHGLTL